METELYVCCVEMLNLLLGQYDAGKMDAETFKKNARLKVEFIKDHCNNDYAINNKEAVEQLLHKCSRILNDSIEI